MLILGIDPALTTGLALRLTDESGLKRIHARAEEFKITAAEQAEEAFTDFMAVELPPDLIVIERMFVGKSAEGSISLADMAGWFEMLAAHYYPGVKRLRPFAKQWRASVDIKGFNPGIIHFNNAEEKSKEAQEYYKKAAIDLATSHGVTVAGHNAAEAYCMTFYQPSPNYHYRGKGADGRKR